MSDKYKNPSWSEILETVGSTTYYEEHRKILEELSPDGNFNPAEWNEASVEAIIKAVVVMIEKNNIALLTEIDCAKGLKDDSLRL